MPKEARKHYPFYLIKRGFEYRHRNRSGAHSSVAVLVVCLLLLGGAWLLVANLQSAMENVQKENVIMIYADMNARQRDLGLLQGFLEELENVDEVVFISKKEALEEQISQLSKTSAEALVDHMRVNPLPDSFRVTVHDMGQFSQTAAQIKALPMVDSLRENSELANRLTSLSNTVSIVGAAIVILLIIGSFLVVVNTTRLSMQKSKEHISILRVIGSTEGDIRIPFLVESMLNGTIAGVGAFFAVWGGYTLAINQLASITDGFFTWEFLPFAGFVFPLAAAYTLVGWLTAYVGCRSSVHGYFKEERG
ncbi:MAG: ABC transporter permease [Oscillospiraceae bacterium]|nr:ABC transporter permease [Oscillospiraceae bacterium]